MNKMIIGFVSKWEPFHDRVAWSGTVYKLRESIEKAGFEVRWIIVGTSLKYLILTYSIKIWNYTIGRKSKWLNGFQFRPIAKILAEEIDLNPVVKGCDYLFFPTGAQIALFVKTKKPVISVSDQTAQLMIDYYWLNINKKSKKMAIDLDKAASQKAVVNIRSSQWTIDSVIYDYRCDKEKCYVLEFGPNIDTADIKPCSVYPGEGNLRILFSGRDWNRKGGEIAVEVVERLRSDGIDAQLIVVGPCKCPKSCKDKSYIDFVGYLNKNNPKDYHQYIDLYEKSHIFILPTKAECSAIVYSEAAAAGLPCYTYLTGGVGNYVVNGVNGYTLPEGSPASFFANQIINDIHEGSLSSLREGALRLFKDRLNWEAWKDGFIKIMDKVS